MGQFFQMKCLFFLNPPFFGVWSIVFSSLRRAVSLICSMFLLVLIVSWYYCSWFSCINLLFWVSSKKKLSFCFWTKISKKYHWFLLEKYSWKKTSLFSWFWPSFCFFNFFFHAWTSKTVFAIFSMSFECCQDDSVNCSCFRKDKMTTQGLFDPCACTSQDEYCTTELKKKNKQPGRQRQGRDGFCEQMSMSMKCSICHWKNLHPLLNCRRLLRAVSCHHRSFPFVPSSAISRKRNPNYFASARVRNPSRCFVKRSAVLFFVSTRTHGSAEGLHRQLYCSHLPLFSWFWPTFATN